MTKKTLRLELQHAIKQEWDKLGLEDVSTKEAIDLAWKHAEIIINAYAKAFSDLGEAPRFLICYTHGTNKIKLHFIHKALLDNIKFEVTV